ncbi:hypothetical protein [Nocardia puris]|nr:hypothetical protein [Nocardia puris]
MPAPGTSASPTFGEDRAAAHRPVETTALIGRPIAGYDDARGQL